MTGDNYQGPTQSPNGWRFEKRLSMDTLVAALVLTLGIGGSAFLAWRTMDSRVLVLETTQLQTKEERLASIIRDEKLSVAMQTMQIDIARLITLQQAQQAAQSQQLQQYRK